MDTDLLCVILRPRCCVCVGAGPLESGLLLKQNCRVHVCACVCVFTDAVATRSEAGQRVFLGVRRRRLSPGSPSVNKQEPAVRPAACAPRPGRERRLAPRRGETWWGAPQRSQGSPARGTGGTAAGVGCQRPEAAGGLRAGLGAGPGRHARLPGSWAAAATAAPEGRRVRLPAGQRPARPRGFVTALVQARGGAPAARPGRAPRGGGHPPRPRPSAGRRRVPAGAPGPAWRAGPDPPRLRSGRGGGGEPPGTERRPAGRRGGGRPLGVQGRGQRRGGDASARPAPSDPALGAEWHSPAGRTWLVHSRGRHFLSASPAGLAHRALPAAANRGARPPAAARSAPAWGPVPERGSGSLRKFGGPLHVTTSLRQDAPASVFGPRSRYVCRPTPLPCWRGRREGGWQPEPGAETVFRAPGEAPGSVGVGRSLGHQL